MADGKKIYLIREARVEYYDLCCHTNVSRENFFENAELKLLCCYGLVLESDDLVKVLWCDDVTDNSEGEGIVIPRACVRSIDYFEDVLHQTKTIEPDKDKN